MCGLMVSNFNVCVCYFFRFSVIINDCQWEKIVANSYVIFFNFRNCRLTLRHTSLNLGSSLT